MTLSGSARPVARAHFTVDVQRKFDAGAPAKDAHGRMSTRAVQPPVSQKIILPHSGRKIRHCRIVFAEEAFRRHEARGNRKKSKIRFDRHCGESRNPGF